MGLFDIFKKKADESKNTSTAKVEVTFSEPTVSFQSDEVVPIEKRIKGQEPTCDGLYPHEVLVLSYAPRYCDGGNEYPGFWWYHYGIKDVTGILSSLQSRGFIQKGTIADAANMEKLPVIKEELKKHELKVSGKKADLIQRLVENVDEQELSKVFTKRPFALTKEGDALLKKYEWIPYIHSHNIEDLDVWNLTEIVQTPPYLKFRDKIWGYLNKRALKHSSEGNWGLYRNAQFEMSEFVKEEGKTLDALQILCEVISIDLSGLSNSFNMEYLWITSEHYFPYENSLIKMAPGITGRVEKYAKELGWTEEELRAFLLKEQEKREKPLHIFTAAERVDIVMYEMTENKEALERLYEAAEKRFKKNYKDQLKKKW